MLFLNNCLLQEANNNKNNRLKHSFIIKHLYAYVYLLLSTRKPRKIQPETSTDPFVDR